MSSASADPLTIRSRPSCGRSIGDGGSARGAGMLCSSAGVCCTIGESNAGAGGAGVACRAGILAWDSSAFAAQSRVSLTVPVPEPDEEVRWYGRPPLENRTVFPELLRTLLRLLLSPTMVELVAVPFVCALSERICAARPYVGDVGDVGDMGSLLNGRAPVVGEIGDVGGEVLDAAEYQGIGGSPRSFCAGSASDVTGDRTLGFLALGGGPE